MAWVDNANRTLYHTKLSSTSNAQTTTQLIQHGNSGSSYFYGQYGHKNLELVIGAGDDPWIIWTPYSRNNAAYNMVAHYGSPIDSSLDSTVYPGDHDGDGTCDMLEVATLDYGVENMIFEMEMDLSLIHI